MPIDDTYDPEALAELILDIRRGLRFIREAQGYGRITIEMDVRKGRIAMWEVSQGVTKKSSEAVRDR